MTTPSIIVADGNALYLEMLRGLLIEQGYPHVQCIQGQLTFDLVRREQPDLVLLDINMAHPGQGWRILDMLRLHPATTHIPVILCSTDPRILREKAARLEEMRCDTLEKPFNLEELLVKVRAIVGPPPREADEKA